MVRRTRTVRTRLRTWKQPKYRTRTRRPDRTKSNAEPEHEQTNRRARIPRTLRNAQTDPWWYVSGRQEIETRSSSSMTNRNNDHTKHRRDNGSRHWVVRTAFDAVEFARDGSTLEVEHLLHPPRSTSCISLTRDKSPPSVSSRRRCGAVP